GGWGFVTMAPGLSPSGGALSMQQLPAAEDDIADRPVSGAPAVARWRGALRSGVRGERGVQQAEA
ncbi:hypothetical protein DD559_19450, partial [Sphingomonas pokkalii]